MTRESAIFTSDGEPGTHRRTEPKPYSLRASVSPWFVVAAMVAALSANAQAQTLSVRGFGDIGVTAFSASESFEAILGESRGTVFGGGGEVVFGPGVFVGVRASRFEAQGERVFIFEGERFELGIDTTIRITPVELSAGYRAGHGRWRVVPYGGGGIGWHRYEETSEFATDEENVDERHTGYHLLGGAELRLARWVGIAGEAQWTTVPDAIGQDDSGVSAAFGETNLGGTSFRVRVVIGR